MASVSIVLPTRDRPDFLLEALDSIAGQTHPELELILVRDGGAPFDDAVRRAVDRLEFPTTYLEHDGESGGAAVSRNRALDHARGDAIAFLDDDDLWEPGHAAALAALLDREPDVDVAYADARIVQVERGETRHIARDFDAGVFERDGYIPPSAFAARRSAFERFGRFDPDFTFTEDWEWLIRVERGGGRLKRARGETAVVRIHAGGLSALSPDRVAKRRVVLDRLAERYGLPPIEPKTFWEVAASL